MKKLLAHNVEKTFTVLFNSFYYEKQDRKENDYEL